MKEYTVHLVVYEHDNDKIIEIPHQPQLWGKQNKVNVYHVLMRAGANPIDIKKVMDFIEENDG